MNTGRPKASSRETLAEAACELFLEQGYEATTVADITQRAGVSRSSFFNYFAAKGDVVWSAFDERMSGVLAALDADAEVPGTLAGAAAGFEPDSLALAIANAQAMGLADELERDRAVRQLRLAGAIAARLRRSGDAPLAAEVRAAGLAGAVLSAVWAWATGDPGRVPLSEVLAEALAAAPVLGDVRQLRVVVRAEDFDDAVRFYRDVAGMPQAEAYEADGGAHVVILDAGRATLELSNPAQVAFIDRVETDGDAPSDPIRLALEVDDARETAARLAAAGADVQASVRETPWRSLNGRLRAPAGLQLTVFQELGPARDGE